MSATSSAETTPRPSDTADTHPSAAPLVGMNQEQSLPEVAVADAVVPVASRAVAASDPARPEVSPADTHEPRVHAEEVTLFLHVGGGLVYPDADDGR